jgi:hypothetical protein
MEQIHDEWQGLCPILCDSFAERDDSVTRAKKELKDLLLILCWRHPTSDATFNLHSRWPRYKNRTTNSVFIEVRTTKPEFFMKTELCRLFINGSVKKQCLISSTSLRLL